jgi:hypothetical protein
LAARFGIVFSGSAFVGTGVAAIYGDVTLFGAFDRPVVVERGDPISVESVNEIHQFPYTAWESLAPENLWLNGGAAPAAKAGMVASNPSPSGRVPSTRWLAL